MTGFPSRCPHGEPIPDQEGELPQVNDTCLINLAVGYKGIISRVRTNEPERLQYFASLGLVPGVEFEIVGRAPFNGPMRLRVGRDEVVLGVELVKALWVT
jgi:DtxR family Mn-dependent transcriptional regulator